MQLFVWRADLYGSQKHNELRKGGGREWLLLTNLTEGGEVQQSDSTHLDRYLGDLEQGIGQGDAYTPRLVGRMLLESEPFGRILAAKHREKGTISKIKIPKMNIYIYI